MTNLQIPETQIAQSNAQIEGVILLQPALVQLAEQLADIESKSGVSSCSLKRSNRIPTLLKALPFAAATLIHTHRTQPRTAPRNQRTARLRIYCFGRFEVYHGDEPILLQRSGKGNLILKFLTMSRQPVLPRCFIGNHVARIGPAGRQ